MAIPIAFLPNDAAQRAQRAPRTLTSSHAYCIETAHRKDYRKG